MTVVATTSTPPRCPRRTEPPPESWRLRSLRGWSDDKQDQVSAGTARAGGEAGGGAATISPSSWSGRSALDTGRSSHPRCRKARHAPRRLPFSSRGSLALFLFWYPGLASPTLDLNPGKGFVESGGSTAVAAGSNRWLVAIGLVGTPPAAGSRAFGQSSILTLHPAAAPAIDACA